MVDIERLLVKSGLTEIKYFGFVTKAKWGNVIVDLFNPESKEDERVYGEAR